jgi:hypothetical protein
MGVAFANSFVIRFTLVWAVVLSLFLVLRISYPIPSRDAVTA